MSNRFDKSMAEYGHAALREKLKRQQKKADKLSDDPFKKFLRKNSMLNKAQRAALAKKERKIGRPRPNYCELHEALVLDPRTIADPVADHCHITGKYRGWICISCNTHLLPVIDYLRATGIEAGDIKAFLNLAVDYAFTDGKVIQSRLGLDKKTS